MAPNMYEDTLLENNESNQQNQQKNRKFDGVIADLEKRNNPVSTVYKGVPVKNKTPNGNPYIKPEPRMSKRESIEPIYQTIPAYENIETNTKQAESAEIADALSTLNQVVDDFAGIQDPLFFLTLFVIL